MRYTSHRSISSSTACNKLLISPTGGSGSAQQMATSMDARGFASAHHRTWAEPAPWTPADTVGLVLAVALGAVAPVALVLT